MTWDPLAGGTMVPDTSAQRALLATEGSLEPATVPAHLRQMLLYAQHLSETAATGEGFQVCVWARVCVWVCVYLVLFTCT